MAWVRADMGLNLSAVSSRSVAGKFLRWPLRFVPRELAVPIPQGALRGKRWVVGAATHGCWLGSYEYTKQRLFARRVAAGDIVYDVGANVGFYTLLASVLVGPTGHVVAVEPFPRNVSYLRRHLTLNGVTNVILVEGAAYDRGGVVRITGGPDSSQIRVDEDGALSVRSFALDDLIFHDGLPAPTAMKIDVEGAEGAVLRGARRLLTEHRPLIFLSTHGPRAHAECCHLLRGFGYRLRPIDSGSVEDSSELVAEHQPAARP
jgi:FkbM family methyltransferase